MNPAVSSSQGQRVLVVEDEDSIRTGLCDVLAFRGYDVHAASDGAAALRQVGALAFDLILLDVMLPEVDGFTVCRTLRHQGVQCPVLMLTAKGAEDDVLAGFDAGADDYVTKPFGVRELLARVQALLSRSRRMLESQFRAGPFTVVPGRGIALGPDGELELSVREVHMLRLLTEESGRILSRRVLLERIWGMNNVAAVETRTVDVHIGKLRKKLGTAGELLETVRGQGYRWRDDGSI